MNDNIRLPSGYGHQSGTFPVSRFKVEVDVNRGPSRRRSSGLRMVVLGAGDDVIVTSPVSPGVIFPL